MVTRRGDDNPPIRSDIYALSDSGSAFDATARMGKIQMLSTTARAHRRAMGQFAVLSL
jgi:hypothetical protein